MFYVMRFAELVIISVICSLPAYLQLLGQTAFHSLAEGKLQLICFFVFLALDYLTQIKVYKYDKRWSYYVVLSCLGILPYTVLSIVLYLVMPINIYNLFFMPMVFYEWLGVSYLLSIIMANVTLYLIVLIAPAIRRAVRRG